MRIFTVIACCLLWSIPMAAQIVVADAQSNEPIEGVTAIYTDASGQQQYLFSDLEGKIDIRQNALVYLSHVSYLPTEVNFRQGQQLDVEMTPSAYSIDEAVVTGQNQQRIARDAVQNVTVIGKKEMQGIGARTAADALALNPRVQIVHDPALGTQVTIAGMSGKHIKVMVDGVPVIGRLDGNIDLDQLPLNDIVRIEIIEGPMSVEYGTDAIGGTINIITNHQNDKTKLLLGASYETTDRSDVQLNAGTKLGRYALSANVRRSYFGGSKYEPEDRRFFWQPKEHYNLGLKLKHQGEMNYHLGMSAFQERLWNDGELQYQTIQQPINDSTTQIIRTPFAVDQDFTTKRFDLRFGADGNIAPRIHFKGFAASNYYHRERLTQRVDLTNLQENLSSNSEDHDTTAFSSWSSRSSVTFDRLLDVSVGYDLSYDQAHGKRFEGNEEDYLNLAAFGSVVFETEHWQLRPGLRYQYNSIFEAPLIPSFHLKYSKSDWNFRASYAKGFRAPDIKELYFYFVDSNHNIQGNTDLKAESSDALQASVTKRNHFEKLILDSKVRVYHNDIENMISLALSNADDLLYTYINIDNQQVSGLEWGQELISERWKGSYNLNYFEQEVAFNAEEAGQSLSTIQAAVSLAYTFPRERISINSQLNYYGQEQQFFEQNGEVIELIRDPYSMITVSASKQFLEQLDLRLGVRNLLDVQTINSVAQSSAHSGAGGSTPVSLGRAIFINISWKLK